MSIGIQDKPSEGQNSGTAGDQSLAEVDYSEILREMDINYSPYEYYWQVGEMTKTQGWILHLSVVRSQVSELLKVVIPLLAYENIPFKIVRDKFTAQLLLDGGLGYIHVGKIISIYPQDEKMAIDLIRQLISITKPFKGPNIPTDFYLGGIIYTRYGAYNPIIRNLPNGQKIKCIYNHKGELIHDAVTIPFSMPGGISWPFQEITSFIEKKEARLLKNTYYPVSVLKNDVKGHVIKALYFKKWWQVRSCLIKEGRKNMFSDDNGRDIQDRLKWQHDLYNELKNEIPLPRIFDYFKENDNAYLVMEYFKGASISNWINDVYNDQSWHDLPPDIKYKVLDYLAKILIIIQRMHQLGFVHRDITTGNFMVDTRGRIILIDMELTWSNHSNTVTIPFQGGTPGFVSPEQFQIETPTIKEDIYALGGLMIVLFTNLSPIKFPITDQEQLRKSLIHFIGNKEVADVIGDCLELNHKKRPDIVTIQNTLKLFRKLLQQGLSPNRKILSKAPPGDEVRGIIQAGLIGLVCPQLLSPKHRWLSKTQRAETEIGNEQVEVTLYEGWHTGMSGPLWLIGLAKSAEFDISECLVAYRQSWDYIENHFFKDASSTGSALYKGGAGIALALAEGLQSGLLAPDNYIYERINLCFSQATREMSLSDGIAGMGIGLLRASQWMDKASSQNLLRSSVEILLKSQQSSGCWNLQPHRKDKTYPILNFSKGIPGIIWFLLCYYQYYQDRQVKDATIMALHWMIKKTKYQQIRGLQKLNEALLFIKAFNVLRDDIYYELAERYLNSIPARPILTNYTLQGGLAALGELYLDANEIFNDPKWTVRTDWITQVFLHSFSHIGPNQGYWISGVDTTITADLFTGNAGILHYLIRYSNPGGMKHPLSPSCL